MKNLKRFYYVQEYTDFTVSGDMEKPNVSLTEESGDVWYNIDNGWGNYYTKGEIDTLIVSLNSYVSAINNRDMSAISALSGRSITFDENTNITKISQLTNDAGFLTSSDISQYITGVTESDPTVPNWAKSPNKPNYNASEIGALATGTTLDEINDGSSRKLSTLMLKDGDKVLVTNDYTTADKNKLAGIASGAQVNTIESVKVNGSTLPVSSKAVNVTVPTNIGTLTNDSDFITTANTKNFITTGAVATQIEGYGYTNNAGTITGVTMNNASKGTSGVANLGMVVTSLKINTTNASVNNGAASVTLTLPTGLPSVSASDNGKTLKVVNGAWAASN